MSKPKHGSKDEKKKVQDLANAQSLQNATLGPRKPKPKQNNSFQVLSLLCAPSELRTIRSWFLITKEDMIWEDILRDLGLVNDHLRV